MLTTNKVKQYLYSSTGLYDHVVSKTSEGDSILDTLDMFLKELLDIELKDKLPNLSTLKGDETLKDLVEFSVLHNIYTQNCTDHHDFFSSYFSYYEESDQILLEVLDRLKTLSTMVDNDKYI